MSTMTGRLAPALSLLASIFKTKIFSSSKITFYSPKISTGENPYATAEATRDGLAVYRLRRHFLLPPSALSPKGRFRLGLIAQEEYPSEYFDSLL